MSVCLLIRPLCLLICPSVCSFVCLFIHSFVMSAFSRLSVYSFVCLSIRPFVCLIIRFFCQHSVSQSVQVHRSARRTLRSVSFLSKLFIFHFCLLEKKNKNNCSCNSTLKMSLFVLFCNHHIAISLRANLLYSNYKCKVFI